VDLHELTTYWSVRKLHTIRGKRIRHKLRVTESPTMLVFYMLWFHSGYIGHYAVTSRQRSMSDLESLQWKLKTQIKARRLTSPKSGGRSVGIVSSRTKATELVRLLQYSSQEEGMCLETS
jgi:hypothetical protein